MKIDLTPQFIDDTSILIEATDLPLLERKAREFLDRLSGWSLQIDLIINHSKTKFLLFFMRKTMETLRLYINNQPILEVNSAKLLGVIIQNDHAEHVITKLSQCLGFLYRNVALFPRYVRKLIYFSLFQSHLIYCLPIWGFLSQDIIYKLLGQQKEILQML